MVKKAVCVFCGLVLAVVNTAFFPVSAQPSNFKTTRTIEVLPSSFDWESTQYVVEYTSTGDRITTIKPNASYDSYGLVTYAWVERVRITCTFTDGVKHSGKILITKSGSPTLWQTDNDNVAVYGNNIYFTDVSAFTLYVEQDYYQKHQSSGNFNGVTPSINANITFGDFTEVSSLTDKDLDDVYLLMSSAFDVSDSSSFSYFVKALYTRNHSDLNSIKTAINNNFSALYSESENKPLDVMIDDLGQLISQSQLIYTSLERVRSELIDQGLTLDSLLLENVDQGLTLDRIESVLNEFLQYEKDFKQYNIPIESFYFNWSFFRNGISTIPISGQSYLSSYPLFDMKNGDHVGFTLSRGRSKYVILGVNCNVSNTSQFNDVFSYADGVTVESFYQYGNAVPQFRFVRVLMTNSTDSNIGNVNLTALRDLQVVPIYVGDGSNLSTQFIEQWFAVDVDVSADALDDKTDEMQDQFDDMFDIESGFTSQLDDGFSSLDFTNPFENAPSFLTSAKFAIGILNSVLIGPIGIALVVVCIIYLSRRFWG